MTNELRELVKLADQPGYIIADDTGLSRSMVYRAIRRNNNIPDDVKMGTLRSIANRLGKRVVISFEPVNDGETK